MKPSSGMCNLSCEYCFYCDETQKRAQASYGFMTEETLRNVIRKTMLRAEGAISYMFQGGEPSLRGLDFYKKAVMLQKQYNKHGVRVTNAFQTNGYLLDEEWCRFFRENHFLVGISLDGIRETHDRYRRTGSGGDTYEKVLAATELLDDNQVDYNILTVVTRDVGEKIEEIYHDYEKNGWNYQQYIACLEPLDEPPGQHRYAITPAEYGRFLIKLFDLWYEDWKKGKQPYIRQFENYIGILMGYPPEACDQGGVCSIQNVVEADGSVYPCDFYMLDEYRLGNFNTDRLDVIDRKRREIRFQERSLLLSEKCRNCSYYSICRGGCQRNRYYVEEEGAYENYFCEGCRVFFDHCLDRMKDIAGALSGKR